MDRLVCSQYLTPYREYTVCEYPTGLGSAVACMQPDCPPGLPLGFVEESNMRSITTNNPMVYREEIRHCNVDAAECIYI